MYTPNQRVTLICHPHHQTMTIATVDPETNVITFHEPLPEWAGINSVT